MFKRFSPWFAAIVIATCSLTCGVGAAQGEDPQLTRYMHGLRQRGLLVIAEEYAQHQLVGKQADEQRRAQLVTELVTTLTLHAELQTGPQQAEMFQLAARTLEQELARTEHSALNRFQLRSEQSLLNLRHAGLLAWEHELAPNAEQQLQAHKLAQNTLVQLQQLVVELPNVSPEVSRTRSEILEDRLLLAIGESHLVLARSSNTSVERTGALVSAASEFAADVKKRARTALAREARLGMATIARLQQDTTQSLTILETLSTLAAPEEFKDRVLLERVRTHLAAGEFDAALEQLTTALRGRTYIADEFHALTVEVLAGAARVAGEKGQAQLQTDLLKQAAQELTLTRGRWYRWGHARLAGSQESLQYGPRLAPLVQAGKAAYARGDLATAATSFEEAARIAHEEHRPNDAVEFALTRGSIFLQQGDAKAAATSFRQLYEAYSTHPRAGEVHLLLCYALGRVMATTPEPVARTEYVTALHQHLQSFPDQPSRHEASWMLGLLYEADRNWSQAVTAYMSIPVTHTRHAAAMLRSVTVDRLAIEELLGQSQDATAHLEQAVERLGSLVRDYPLPPESWSPDQCQIALQGAQLLMLGNKARYADAGLLLQRVLESDQVTHREAELRQLEVDPQWDEFARRARQLKIIALAGQGQVVAARQLLSELESADPQALLALLNGLAELSNNLPDIQRRQVAGMQQEAAVRLQQRRHELTEQQQQQLDEVVAQAYVASGDLLEAVQLYEQLLQRSPQDRRLLQIIARLLEQHGQPVDLKRAQEYWTKLEKQETPGTVPWLQARLEVVRLMHRQGDHAAAKKLLGVTRILYPQLGTPELKQQYETLSQQLR